MTFIKVIQPDVARVQPLFVATAADVSYASGFHDEEREGGDTFRWMGERGLLCVAADSDRRYLEFWVLSEFGDLSQHLSVTAAGRTEDLALVQGWSPLSVPVAPAADQIELRVDRIFPHAYHRDDQRTLAVRIRAPRLHKDPERHLFIRRQYDNSLLNVQEVLAGKTALQSTPPKLGIDLHGACNVKPPCVYCEWDHNKNLEGRHVEMPFTHETLREWGPFFDNSVNLVNCSIGEPFMMKNFDELLDTFGNTGKVVEMTTNGQILTDRNIQKLVGRPVDLYISLDAATTLTYSRLRNDGFEKILDNVRRLIAAKGGRRRLPRVHLVFMPMRCNVHELEAFVHLCAALQADRMVLRPLNYSLNNTLDWKRAGYHYIYREELLPFDELVRVSGRAARLCSELGVDLADQMDFGGAMRELFQEQFDRGQHDVDESPSTPAPSTPATFSGTTPPVTASSNSAPCEPLPSLGVEGQPACLEPWKSLYILRRGVMPCCYGATPIAPMEGYREAWNSPTMQGIRRELLHGRFHDYCLNSPACPIVRKSEQAHTLLPGQRASLKIRQAGWRLQRAVGRLHRGVVWRALTEPRYVRHHVKRLLYKGLGRQS